MAIFKVKRLQIRYNEKVYQYEAKNLSGELRKLVERWDSAQKVKSLTKSKSVTKMY